MTDRILDISEAPARLKVSLDRLVIDQADREEIIIPLADIAVLIIAHQ